MTGRPAATPPVPAAVPFFAPHRQEHPVSDRLPSASQSAEHPLPDGPSTDPQPGGAPEGRSTGDTASELHDRVLRLLAEQTALPPQELRGDRTFRELGVDSLGLVELVVSVENDTGLEFPADLEGVDQDTTLEDAVRVLEAMGRPAAAQHVPAGGPDDAER